MKTATPSIHEADKILIVDDEPFIQKVFSKYLSGKHYDVETADNGEIALEKLRSKPFDLVLTDLRMPRMGGRELLQIMSESFPDVPKIVLTGHGTNEDIILALQTGAYDYLTKPVTDLGILHHSIQRAIERKKLNDERIRYMTQVNQINEIISMLNRGSSTEDIFNALDVTLKKFIPFNTLALMLIHSNPDEIAPRLVASDSGSIITRETKFGYKDPLLKKITEEKVVCALDDIRESASLFPDSRLVDMLDQEDLRSALILPLIVSDRIRGFLLFASKKTGVFIKEHISFLESIGGQISFSIERGELMEEIENHTKNLEQTIEVRTKEILKTQKTTIFALGKLAETRDQTTGDHLERIRSYCVLLAQLLKYSGSGKSITNQFIRDLYDSSILHDIGKVGIPDSVLLKEDTLTEDEVRTIESHAVIGYDALKSASHDLGEDSFLKMAMDIALCHHERWDGSGYPKGLKGAEIPLSARIVAIADVYDALTTERSYKKALSHEDTLAIMRNESEKFDPELFKLFLQNAEEFNEIKIRFKP
jgi:response regulator RpfG family c-di-GMP phosphodiesterase